MARVLVADENIPYASEVFAAFGEVRRLPAERITPAAVRDADVLLVRSVTRVDAALLAGSRVRFVGTTTIGFDHVDTEWLREQGIAFAHAPGCNADSVVEYVLAALLRLGAERGVALRGLRVGVVGHGNIGSRLARRLAAFGARVMVSDPPLAEAGAPGDFRPLGALLEWCDVLTLHVPLTRTGRHATHHLIGTGELARLRSGAWLVNTSRGGVVDGRALAAALGAGRPGAAVLDVWEGEPAPSPELVRLASIATPHIAGHSWDGKVNGTRMVAAALAAFLGAPGAGGGAGPLVAGAGRPDPLEDDTGFRLEAPAHSDSRGYAVASHRLPSDHPAGDAIAETRWLDVLVRGMYDIAADDARMRPLAALAAPARAEAFHRLRKGYPRRRTFGRYVLAEAEVPPALGAAVREGLGVRAE